jgi:hypothetical protein
MKALPVRALFIVSVALSIAALIDWPALEASSAGRPIAANQATSVEDINAKRAAVDQILAINDSINDGSRRVKLGGAFAQYKAVVTARKQEIYERLGQLDKLIAEPRSTTAIDDPAKSPYLNPRPEVAPLVAEYEALRTELSPLLRDFRNTTIKTEKLLGVEKGEKGGPAAVSGDCPPLSPINGNVGSGSADFPAESGQQTGRLLNGLGNISCGSSNPCQLNTAVGLRAYDAYTFTNQGATTACVSVAFEMTGCNLGQALQFSARLGSFDPANPCANYIGDGGAGFSGEFDGSFSFNVPAGQSFVVVVNENDPGGATGCAYRLLISGLLCQAICPPATPINGTVGSGSPDVPSFLGEQTGRILNGLGNVTCGSSNPCSLNTTTGKRAFDAYAFLNPASTTACVTVAFEMTGCALGQALQFSARVGSFDPANPCTNYVGDGGAGFSGEFDGSFSFNVPAGQIFVVVVNENDPGGATGCAYKLTISGIDCSAAPCSILCPPNTTQPNDPNQCGAVVDFPQPVAIGNCGAVSCSPPSGSFFPVGITTVTCSEAGGASCSFTVTITGQPPVIACPPNVTAVAPPNCAQQAGALVGFPAPTVSDSCGAATVVCSPAAGSAFPIGTTTVTCTATGAGGSSSCSFTVTVFDGCLKDDSKPGNVVLFNTATGEYRFCCGGTVVASGVGSVTKSGCEFTITHNASDRRVLIRASFGTAKGTASIQSPVGVLKCSITDRNIFDNTCQCGG